jgi:hypothetical protein
MATNEDFPKQNKQKISSSKPNSMSKTPLIDFHPFLDGDVLDRKHVASAIDEALKLG